MKGDQDMKRYIKPILSLVMCTVLIMNMFAGCAIKGEPPQTQLQTEAVSEEVTQPILEHQALDGEIGRANGLRGESGKYRYNVFYPTFGIKEIDGTISGYAQSIVEKFKKSAQADANNSGEIITLFADYKITTVKEDGEDRIVSVIFRQIFENPYDNESYDKISVLKFDFEAKKELRVYDVFDAGFEEELSKMIRAELVEYDAFEESADSEEFLQNTAGKKMKFIEFALSENSAIFYFDSEKILKQVKDYTQVTIPISKLKDILDEDFAKILLNQGNEDEETQKAQSSETNKKPQSQIPAFVPKPDKAPHGTKYIAFTFSDGPSEKVTSRILDTLARYNAKATFFVSADRMDSSGYTKNVVRAQKMGCEIGTALALKHASPNDLKAEIQYANNKIKSVTGIEPKLLRADKALFNGNESIINMPLILWNIDTQDWKYKDKNNVYRTPAERARDKNIILSNVIDNVDDGDIILMHDIYDMTADAFEEMLPILVKRGYKLVTVSELYRIKGEELQNGKVYRGF